MAKVSLQQSVAPNPVVSVDPRSIDHWPSVFFDWDTLTEEQRETVLSAAEDTMLRCGFTFTEGALADRKSARALFVIWEQANADMCRAIATCVHSFAQMNRLQAAQECPLSERAINLLQFASGYIEDNSAETDCCTLGQVAAMLEWLAGQWSLETEDACEPGLADFKMGQTRKDESGLLLAASEREDHIWFPARETIANS